MKNLFFLVGLAVSILACSHRDKLPRDVLPRQKMQEVLWDVLRAGELLEGYVFKDTARDKAGIALRWYDSIYGLHKITKADFDRSYDYYKKHPELMKAVLDSLAKKTAPPATADTALVKPDAPKPGGPDSIQEQPRDTSGLRPAKKDTVTRRRGLPGARDRLLFIDSVKKTRGSLRTPDP